MNKINEAEIRNTWAPIIEEATGINDSNKLAWDERILPQSQAL